VTLHGKLIERGWDCGKIDAVDVPIFHSRTVHLGSERLSDGQ
jgi:hypothetical protein